MMLLTTLIFLPLLTALLLVLIPANFRFVLRALSLLATFVTMVLAVVLFAKFQPGVADYQFTAQASWLPALGISYHVGVDGLNVALVLMAAIVGFAATCVSWEIKTGEKLFYILLLLIIGGIIGAFASLDLFFFYFFNELALVPVFIMIGVWGRGPDKNYATFQITLYLSLGAFLALFGLIALYVQSGANSLDLVVLKQHLAQKPLEAGSQKLIFPMLLFGFGVLVGLVPFHTWAPLGYGSAPTATAMMHAGVLKKAGLYAIIRVALPFMPQGVAEWMPILAWLCLGNILYCGWLAMRQKDLNLLIGYSSLAHMGFVFLGIASVSLIGITGAVVIMVAHGLLAALSFALSGWLYNQTGTLEMAKLGGLMRKMPFVGMALVICFMAGCGLPGFGNFVGEALVMFGAWKSLPWFVVAAAWGGLVIGGIYMLRAIRSVVHGPQPDAWSGVSDAGNIWRKLPFAVLIAALIIFGCFPKLLTERIKPNVAEIVEAAAAKAPAKVAVTK
ncbi:MAG: NADH-quinone oxidoreductase subunit M [Verrucomicrobia bacterium]|nr:NADH-quinone oxidoreductase subunit M [Verrucomicrobiota bacterium]